MGIFDKAKELIEDHPEQVDQTIGKAGDLADERTGNKYEAQIDEGQKFVRDHLESPEADKPA